MKDEIVLFTLFRFSFWWFLAVREDHRLTFLDNNILKTVFGPKNVKVILSLWLIK